MAFLNFTFAKNWVCQAKLFSFSKQLHQKGSTWRETLFGYLWNEYFSLSLFLLEIPDFLNESECNHIISLAEKVGLRGSDLHLDEELEKSKEVVRGNLAFLYLLSSQVLKCFKKKTESPAGRCFLHISQPQRSWNVFAKTIFNMYLTASVYRTYGGKFCYFHEVRTQTVEETLVTTESPLTFNFKNI